MGEALLYSVINIYQQEVSCSKLTGKGIIQGFLSLPENRALCKIL
jgi:hypothetical protein